MATVLVIGAAGYIGFGVAQVLRQSGYKVYGVTRQKDQLALLARHEIIPILGDAHTPSTYAAQLRSATIIIDASGDHVKPSHRPPFDAARAASLEAQTTGLGGKKVYIYTSGILVHGHNELGVFESETEVTQTPEQLKWRVAFEKEVVGEPALHGIVIRPGFVYGYAGGSAGKYFHNLFDYSSSGGKIVIDGRPEKRWSWVHIHDLANAYLLAVQKYSIASGQIFDVALPNAPTLEALFRRAAEIAGYKNPEVVVKPVTEPSIFEATTRVSYQKIHKQLGWHPGHSEILDDLEAVYVAWKAVNQK